MAKIHFIINPISGSGNHKINEDLVLKYFDKNKVTLKYSQYKRHAVELTKKSIEEKAEIIVACGGDGTINEVASCIVNTDITLGIIAVGSGNGLASNLKIPKNIDVAMRLIQKKNKIKIDVGIVNETYFFSNMGIGFDAEVIHNYDNFKSRGFISYIKASIKSIKSYKYATYKYIIENVESTVNPFLFFISNSNEMGNNVTITPKASLHDGLLDIVIVQKMNNLKLIVLGFLVMIRKHLLLNAVTYMQIDKLIIEKDNKEDFIMQIDGEKNKSDKDKLYISLLKRSLSVIVKENIVL